MSAPSRSHAHVGFLIIIALVSLLLALGLYALAWAFEVKKGPVDEHYRQLEQAAQVHQP